jgi:hypothetical protein
VAAILVGSMAVGMTVGVSVIFGVQEEKKKQKILLSKT